MSGSATPLVTFNYTTWAARYPEFSTVQQMTAQEYFDEATVYVNNTPNSLLAGNIPLLTTVLNMLTAHIAALSALGPDGQLASTLVGRISNATEGAVSVATDFQVSGLAAWFSQTRYGAAAWQALAQYRTARYVRKPCYPYGYGGYNNAYGGY
jgi:hypothetical protein